jgi:hypothetical protein
MRSGGQSLVQSGGERLGKVATVHYFFFRINTFTTTVRMTERITVAMIDIFQSMSAKQGDMGGSLAWHMGESAHYHRKTL